MFCVYCFYCFLILLFIICIICQIIFWWGVIVLFQGNLSPVFSCILCLEVLFIYFDWLMLMNILCWRQNISLLSIKNNVKSGKITKLDFSIAFFFTHNFFSWKIKTHLACLNDSVTVLLGTDAEKAFECVLWAYCTCMTRWLNLESTFFWATLETLVKKKTVEIQGLEIESSTCSTTQPMVLILKPQNGGLSLLDP